MNNNVLYAVDKKGGWKVWSIWAAGDTVTISHGKYSGKLQLKSFIAKPKNVGRANATTAEQQAILMMESRIRKQLDKGYRFTIEEAEQADKENRLPMLASDFTKVGHSIQFPCYASPKLDGVRCTAKIVDDVLVLTSRGGKQYPVPDHLAGHIRQVIRRSKKDVLDGELYIHGVSLQNIISAVKKSNELTPLLEFWIFDIPSDKPFYLRDACLEEVHRTIQDLRFGAEKFPIKVVLNEWVESKEHARSFMNYWLERGFEGMMLRNVRGMYEWNHRSRDLQKWKDFKDAEFLVIGYESDELGEAVYHLKHRHVIKGKTREYFKAKPRGNHEYRSVDNVRTFIGNWVTVRFQQYTDAGVPQFGVIVAVRECTEDGVPLE